VAAVGTRFEAVRPAGHLQRRASPGLPVPVGIVEVHGHLPSRARPPRSRAIGAFAAASPPARVPPTSREGDRAFTIIWVNAGCVRTLSGLLFVEGRDDLKSSYDLA